MITQKVTEILAVAIGAALVVLSVGVMTAGFQVM